MGRMLVLRALRPDKCVPAVQLYVEAMLGRRFIEPPPFDLAAAFGDSSVSLPLIFILVSGADPVKGLIQYAELSGMGEKIDYISLGQGQGPKAEALIKGGAFDGLHGVEARAALAATVEDAMKSAQGRSEDRRVGQMTFFGDFEAPAGASGPGGAAMAHDSADAGVTGDVHV
jgi:hypothetical protein